MSSGQKVAFSLLISVLAFCAFTVVAFSGLFDLLEVNFYQPIVQDIKQKKIEKIAAAQNEYFDSLMKRFDAFSVDPSVKTYTDTHPSDAAARKRETFRSQLFAETDVLKGIRIVGENGRNIFFSTFAPDLISGKKGIVYRNYDTSGEIDFDSVSSRKLADADSPADKKCRIIKDGNAGRIIFSFPFYNSENDYSGTILFYCDPSGFTKFLKNRNLIDVSGSLITESLQPGKDYDGFGGFVFGPPNYGQSSIRQEILKKWHSDTESFWKITATENPESPNILDKSKTSSLCAFSYKNTRADLGFITLLYDESELKFPPYIRILLLATAFVTLYLAIFLILSFKHDDIVVIRDKVRRYENEFFIGYKKMGDVKSSDYLAEQKPVLERRILKSLGKKGEKHAAEFKSIFEGYWQEMLASFGENSPLAIGNPGVTVAIDADELKKIVRSSLEDILENGKIQINAVQGPRSKDAVGKVIPERKEQIPGGEELEDAEPVSNDTGDVAPVEDAEPVDEIEPVEEAAEELEDFSDVEETEAIEEVDSVEEIESDEEAGDAEPVDEIESVEEIDEAEPVEEVESAEEVEDAEAVENVEPVEDAEPLEDAESVEEIDEAEPVEDVEPAEEVEEAEPVEDVEPLEGIDDVEPVEEVDEAEPVEEAEDAEPVEDVEPAEEVDDVEPVEDVEPLEEIDEAEPLEEVEDVESIEEIDEAESVEDVESVEEIDEAELVEDIEPLEEIDEAEPVEEVEDAETVEEVDELEEIPEAEELDEDSEAVISKELEPITDLNEELCFGDGRVEADDSTPTKFATVTEDDLKQKFEEELEVLPEVSEKEEREVDIAKTLAALPEHAPQWSDNDDLELDSSGLSRKLSASEMHDIEKLKEVALAIDVADNELEELEVFDPTQKKDDTETLDTDFYLPHLMDNNIYPDDDIYKDESLLEKIEFGVPKSEIFFEETDDSVADNFVAAPVDYSFLDEDDVDEKMYEEVPPVDIKENEHFFENINLLNLEKKARENGGTEEELDDEDAEELLPLDSEEELLEAEELDSAESEIEEVPLEEDVQDLPIEPEIEEQKNEEYEAEELKVEELEDFGPENIQKTEPEVEQEPVQTEEQKDEKNAEKTEETLNDSNESAENHDYLPIEELDDSDVEDLEELEKNMPFMFTQFGSTSNTQIAELVDLPDAIVQDSDGTFHVTEMPKSDSRISLNMDFKRLVDSILY
ncbi:MAG: DUF4573 domain-containing protein [Treponema sp.]|uniref:DUF4573 domain-containing protein n=1 Tax=Treponema sp. TaxID=166 RepID=UPI002A914DCD|nr:DUF4573 domain-containing protein [Treponema sp.]MDY6397496.1 DUF4573 domain-containing protein [Treponema sp.]